MALVHVLLAARTMRRLGVPLVSYEDEDSLALRLTSAVERGPRGAPGPGCRCCFPARCGWKPARNAAAQHYAITLLDALCSALQG